MGELLQAHLRETIFSNRRKATPPSPRGDTYASHYSLLIFINNEDFNFSPL